MKAIKPHFNVVLFIMLYKVVLTFKSVDKTQSVTIQIRDIEQYFYVVLPTMLYKVVLTLLSVDKHKNLVCDQSNEAFQQYFHAVLSIMFHKGVLTIKSVDVTLVLILFFFHRHCRSCQKLKSCKTRMKNCRLYRHQRAQRKEKCVMKHSVRSKLKKLARESLLFTLYDQSLTYCSLYFRKAKFRQMVRIKLTSL